MNPFHPHLSGILFLTQPIGAAHICYFSAVPVRFSRQSRSALLNDIYQTSGNIDFLDDLTGQLVCYCSFTCCNRILFGDICSDLNGRTNLAVYLNCDFHFRLYRLCFFISRPAGLIQTSAMSYGALQGLTGSAES